MYKFYYTKPDRRCYNGIRSWVKEFPTKAAGFKYAAKSDVQAFSYTEPGNPRLIQVQKVF